MRPTPRTTARPLLATDRRRPLRSVITTVTATLCASLIGVGCATSSNAVDPTAPSPAATQPSGATVRAADFEALWAACDAVARDLLFTPAIQDRRGGLYETEPMLSGQWFEPWRRELRTPDAVLQSSLASIRRTLTFRVERDGDAFVARPIVNVERYALSERRITSSASYRSVFRERTSRNAQFGSIERDAGVVLPDAYWYDVGRDPALERYLAEKIERRIDRR